MTDANVNALILAVPLTITALGGAWVAIQSINKKADKVIENQAATDKKVVEIHTATNGTLSALTKQFEVAQKEIEGLKALIGEMVTSKKEVQKATEQAKIK